MGVCKMDKNISFSQHSMPARAGNRNNFYNESTSKWQ